MFFFKKKPSQIVAIKHMPSTQSATWQDFIRQLGGISFGNLAGFHSATWQTWETVKNEHIGSKAFAKP